MRYFISTNRVLIIFGLLMLLLLSVSMDDAFAEITANANHDHIAINSFYHGSTVSISGFSNPRDADLIIKLTSPDGHQSLRKKGKVASFLWMNTGELKIENVPNVYFLYSTRKIEDILSREEMDKYIIGYPAIEKHATINVPAGVEKTKWFSEFIKFKESSKLFDTSVGKISTTKKDRKQDYSILAEWPYQVPPGNYTAQVYAVKDKKVIETAAVNVLVEQVGMVKSFADMAKNNAALYGLISIAVALGAGFGVGMVFRKSGGAH